MHAGDSRSRQRTTSAMSSGRIMSVGQTWPRTHSVIGVSTKPGQNAVTWIAVAGELLVRRLGERDHAGLRGRVGGQPALGRLPAIEAVLTISAAVAPASFSSGIASRVVR